MGWNKGPRRSGRSLDERMGEQFLPAYPQPAGQSEAPASPPEKILFYLEKYGSQGWSFEGAFWATDAKDAAKKLGLPDGTEEGCIIERQRESFRFKKANWLKLPEG